MLIKRGLKHLSRVSDVFFRKIKLEREITVFPDDLFLTSYPRSGNTWCRFLLGNLVYRDEPMTFLNLERRIPDMYVHADREMRNLPRPRIIKSHECFEPRYQKIVYIVRDPRDVAISNYHWEMKKGSFRDQFSIEQFVPKWMESYYWPRLGCWADHVTSWLSTREGHSGFVVVRYEDLQADPIRELAKIAPLLGIEPTPDRLNHAVEFSSADRMREMEKNQAGKWVQTKYTRQDKPFVRKASTGNWRSVLPPESAALIESKWGHLMTHLGYQPTERISERAALSHASR
jgi:hypothetical protein